MNVENIFATDDNIEDLLRTRQLNGPHLNPDDDSFTSEMILFYAYLPKFSAAQLKLHAKPSELIDFPIELMERLL